MAEKTYSITRTKATWKPRVTSADLPFFLQGESTLLGMAGPSPASFSDPGRNPIAELPYADAAAEGAQGLMQPEDLPAGMSFDYAILGGYNNNAVKISWSIADERYKLSWVALKTFTGFQVKYVLPKKRSPLVFALADEDAYVYCDESPCLECVFMCKRGFVAYACVENLGIVRLPLERASAHWESR